MRIRRSDMVAVMKGKDRGKHGKVIQVFPKEGRVVVEGLNIAVKHLRRHERRQKRGESPKGEKITFSAPMNVANVMLLCPACGKRTRIGIHVDEKRRRQRQCKKCKAVFV
ncbi:MAG: 50S ribosomal protein L24 [Parcubacteria group bacterium]|nr:50S ribosomal protein L24 [Parcubacteria group bacterium]